MESEFVQLVLRQIREDRASKVQRVTSGSCTSDEYKYLCGEIHGLDLAEDHIKAVQQKVEGSDDE